MAYRSISWARGDWQTTVSRPRNLAEGDRLIAIHVGMVFEPGTLERPSGSGWVQVGTPYTRLVEWMGGHLEIRVWEKTAGRQEPSSYRFYQDLSGWAFVVAMSGVSGRVRYAIATASGGEGQVTQITTPGVTAPRDGGTELRFVAALAEDGFSADIYPPQGHRIRAEDWDFGIGLALTSREIAEPGTTGSAVYRFDDWVNLAVAVTVLVPVTDAAPLPPSLPDFAPGRGSALYRYTVHRFLDGEYQGDIEPIDVKFDHRLGEAGTFNATLEIANPTQSDLVAQLVPRHRSEIDRGPGPLAVHVWRGGDLWGWYWLTGATVRWEQRGRPTVELRGAGPEAWLLQVEIQEDLQFWATDQVEIARSLLQHLQTLEGADLRLTLQDGTSGVLRDRTYLAADKSSYGQRLRELSEVENGFEWRILPRVEGGSVVREWQWGYPTLGDPEALHVVSASPHGGDVIGWSIDIDALRGGTHFRVRGDAPPAEDTSEPQPPLMSSVHRATAHLAAGWPRIDRTEDRQGVVVQQTLEEYAAHNLRTLAGAVWVRQVSIVAGERTTISPAAIGERVRVMLVDLWHPRRAGGASYAVTHRLIGLEVQPPTRGRDKEILSLLLGPEVDE